VGELARDSAVSPSTVSHHLKELSNAGLIRMERHGQRVDCSVDQDVFRELLRFLEAQACAAPTERDRTQ